MARSMKEISIWVDQFYGAIIGHGRFVRSMCYGESQNSSTSKLTQWNQPGTTYFDREDLPLACCKVKKVETEFHLFSLGEAAWGAFHEAHMLSELDFQPDLAGMIVVIDRKTILYSLSLKGTSDKDDNLLTSYGPIHFSWFEKQKLPYVVAAAGYHESKTELEQLREALKLSPDIPMIPGPPLPNNLLFDIEHANQVLLALHGIL